MKPQRWLGSEDRLLQEEEEEEDVRSPAGPLTPQGPSSCGATHPRCGQSPADGGPGIPGPARKGPPGQRAVGRAAAPASPRGDEGRGGRAPAPGPGVPRPRAAGPPFLRRCAAPAPRRPRSAGSGTAAPPAAAPGAAGRRGRGRRCRRRRAGSGRPAPTSARSPAAPGVERGLGASRERGGRCFPRRSPAGGARPWLVPVRPLRAAGTHRAGVGERAAPCAAPRSEGTSGLLRCGRGAAAEVARGDGRPGEVPRQRR